MRISPPQTFRRSAALLAALVLGVGLSPSSVHAQAKKPYTKDAIVGMLKGQVAPQRVAVLVRERGIDFEITPQVEGELHRAGATDALLATLRELAPKPSKPPLPSAQPTRIIIETSPAAQVYLDDTFKGQASSEGRLVIANPPAGQHTLRVSLAGKKEYEKPVTVTAGQVSNVQATLADMEKPKPTVGTIRENAKDGLKYVWISPGTFMMGCSPGDSECDGDEKPSHQVTISKGFWIGQTEVTVGAYKRFAGGTGKGMPTAPSFNEGWSNEQMPIVDVTWDEARAYCGWSGGRLPTEAEWEYAARGGSTEARYGDLDSIAWYSANSGGATHNVGEKRANGFGLFDVLGNMWEWVNDWFDQDYYLYTPSQDPPGPSSGALRVLRGGSWYNYRRRVRVSYRNWLHPGVRGSDLGFRCVGEVGSP